MTTLKENLLKKMAEMNLNPNSLARKAGLESSAVKNIMQGKSIHPRIDTLYSICKILHCGVEELYGVPYTNKSSALINDINLMAKAVDVVDSLIDRSGRNVNAFQKATLYLGFYEFNRQGIEADETQFQTLMNTMGNSK